MMAQGTKGKLTRKAGPARISPATRERLLAECGYECSIPRCHVRSRLQVHHIDGDKSNNDPSNLLVLCRSHHRPMAHGPQPRLTEEACRQLKKTIATLHAALNVDKADLRERWRECQAASPCPERRGALFASVVEDLLASIRGLKIQEKRPLGSRDEVRIVIRNEAADEFLKTLGWRIVVECRAHKRRRVHKDEVAAPIVEAMREGRNAALLFSLSGYTPEATDMGRTGSSQGVVLALFGPQEITEMIEADDRVECIKQAVERARFD